MQKEKEYVKNTIILLLGKLSTQFISFFMLPLYTHYLDTESYGMVDLIQTYISLFIPIIILRFDSAVFRFLIDNREDNTHKTNIISNVFIVMIIQTLLFIIGIVVISKIIVLKYVELIIVNVIALMFSNILLQIIRGLGNNKEYAISCIIVSVITLISNLILILNFRMDARSILISSSIANIIVSIYIVIKNNICKYIKLKYFSLKKIKKMLKYSLPMIPNALSWWIVSASDRTIITLFIGASANGIYTISGKCSNILNNIFSVFSMSWQETATLHINDTDRDNFFSKMINKIYIIFYSISLIIIIMLPFLFDIIIGEEYIQAYNYIPILLFANTFNILIGLIGGIYVAKKMTTKIANTTIVSAIINIVVNLCLIRKINLYAACISTLIAYLVMAIYRYIDVQKYVKIKLDFTKTAILTALFIIGTINYYISNTIISICINIPIIICIIYINREMCIYGIQYMKNEILRLKGMIERT